MIINQIGAAAPSAEPGVSGDITFYDCDGTVVTSWSLAELAGKTALPDLPSHDGLVCQGWNWTLAELKTQNTRMNVGALYITDDGKTRIYIHLGEGRTSPVLGLGVSGTVTVDWGDGTTPDTLTGTSTSTVKQTPAHNYAAPGDYVIKLTVSGSAAFLGSSSAKNSYIFQTRYLAAVRKIEIGSGVTAFQDYALSDCVSLTTITLSSAITGIKSYSFNNCNSLKAIIFPPAIKSVAGYTCNSCSALSVAALPAQITSIGSSAFSKASPWAPITIPSPVTNIGSYAFDGCRSATVIALPLGVSYIGIYAFRTCVGVALYDFTHHTAVPTLSNINAFEGIDAGCQIRVPAALADEWKAATNWASYADYIVGV